MLQFLQLIHDFVASHKTARLSVYIFLVVLVREKPRGRVLIAFCLNPFAKGGFLRNSRKYGLGYLRNTFTEGIPPIVPSCNNWT